MQAILTSPTGIRSDIGWLISVLLDYGMFEDYYSAETSRAIRRLGQKLTMAGGTLAPIVVLLALEPYVTKAYAAHIAGVWRLDEIPESAIEEDGMPGLSISGMLMPDATKRTAAR